MKIKQHDSILLCMILVVAAVLRLWNFSSIPLMPDELSALMRTHFNSYSDLINYGVKVDTHPAGVQVFLFYWVKLFGDAGFIVKLPFIVFGLLSILFAYKIAKFWFNSTVGLITASFMTGLQYMVMYSQIERPYISGLFFSMLMVWCWTNFLFNPGSKKIKWWIGYVLSGALCAYDHHFALLFAATVGLTGLLFLNRNNWKAYLLAGVAIFALYIPHLNLFFVQLKMGGIGGWLGKPEPGWIILFIRYVFHFSYWIYTLVIILILISLVKQSGNLSQTQKFRIIAVCWFFSQFIIAYVYSIKVNPLLQFSTLIFVFPFFLMFLFSLFRDMNIRFKILIMLVILTATSCSLIFERKHYTVFYKQQFEQVVTDSYTSIDMAGDAKKCTIELFLPPKIAAYYFKKYNRKFDYINFDGFDSLPNPKQFNNFVNRQSTDYFICGNLPLDYVQIIKKSYPFMMEKDEGFTYSFYCFSKKKSDDLLHDKIVFSNARKGDQETKIAAISDSLLKRFFYGKGAYVVDSNNEYSPSLNVRLKDIVSGTHNIVNIRVTISAQDSAADPLLVFDLGSDNKSIIWAASEYKNFMIDRDSNTVVLSQMISETTLKQFPDATLKIYVWNRSKNKLMLSSFSDEVIEGNPYIYGLFEGI